MREHNIAHVIAGELATNCWIYPLAETGGAPPGFQNCAVIDPGGDAGKIIARLEQLKCIPQYILLTHGHFDHIAAVPALAAAYQPLIAIHRGDAEYLGPGSFDVHCRCFAAAGADAGYIDAHWQDMPPPDRCLEEGGEIGPFTVLHLPGHTPGSIAFWDKAAHALFSGDTLFRADYGRTDLPGGSETQLFASLRRLFALDPAITVYPGHGPLTTIGEESGRHKNIML